MADKQSSSRRTSGSRQEPSRRGARERQDQRDRQDIREPKEKQTRQEPRERQDQRDRQDTQSRQDTRIRRDQMIHCDRCGEDYSATYRRCPFCDERASSGKRPSNRRGGGYGAPVNPVQVASVVVGLVIIIAALYIIFTKIGPFFFGDKDPGSSSGSPGTSQVDPNSSNQNKGDQSGDSSSNKVDPSGSSSAGQLPPSGSNVPEKPVTPEPPAVVVNSITLNKTDLTLNPDEHTTLKATVDPQGAGTVTWSSDRPDVLNVSESGTVVNINSGTKKVKVTVTASIGGKTATCTIYCKPGSKNTPPTTPTTPTPPTPSTPTTPTTPDPQPSAGTLKPGTTAVITGAGNGLNVRSGPSKDSEVVASILNGNTVIIKEDAGNGWYKIDYGNNKLGYISSSFVKAK